MKRTLIILLCFVAFVSMSFIFTKETAPRYKNLKILPKDITKQQMDSVMRQFSASLGVKCGFCHSYNQEQKSMDFASDVKKEKNTAREMWRMNAKLNKKSFDVKNSKELGAKLEVSCFTCHHGAKDPETKAPVKMGPPPGAGQQGAPQGGEATPHMTPGEATSQPTPGAADSTKH